MVADGWPRIHGVDGETGGGAGAANSGGGGTSRLGGHIAVGDGLGVVRCFMTNCGAYLLPGRAKGKERRVRNARSSLVCFTVTTR